VRYDRLGGVYDVGWTIISRINAGSTAAYKLQMPVASINFVKQTYYYD